MADIAVSTTPTQAGWACTVEIRDATGATRHTVTVSRSDLERLDPGAIGPGQIVHRSIAFLLEREPKESILASFELRQIGRYFPEYEAEIGRR